MNIKYRILSLVILLILSACIPPGSLGQPSGGHESLEEATGQDMYLYSLTEVTDNFYLVMDITVDQGTFSWQVQNPSGEVVLEGQATAGEQRVDKEILPVEEGVWTLDVRYENASGGYTYEWLSETE